MHTLAEHYNEDPTNISGLETALVPLITQDHVNHRFKIRDDLLTNRNVIVIDILMKDLDKKKKSLFDFSNTTLKMILRKFSKTS